MKSPCWCSSPEQLTENVLSFIMTSKCRSKVCVKGLAHFSNPTAVLPNTLTSVIWKLIVSKNCSLTYLRNFSRTWEVSLKGNTAFQAQHLLNCSTLVTAPRHFPFLLQLSNVDLKMWSFFNYVVSFLLWLFLMKWMCGSLSPLRVLWWMQIQKALWSMCKFSVR